MIVRDTNYEAVVRASLAGRGLMALYGAKLVRVERVRFEMEVPVSHEERVAASQVLDLLGWEISSSLASS